MKLPVTEAEFESKTKELTETKLEIALEDGTSIFLSLWSEHEYQLEAFEDSINAALSHLKGVPLSWVERIDDRYLTPQVREIYTR